MSPPRFHIVGIGEILWDLLQGGKQLGGAPATFVCHARALGASAQLISCLGNATSPSSRPFPGSLRRHLTAPPSSVNAVVRCWTSARSAVPFRAIRSSFLPTLKEALTSNGAFRFTRKT
jgi:hypothetical protein